MSNRIAIIDIGSNSVRYMEAECTSGHVHSLYKELDTTRLAAGQDAAHRLQPDPMRHTAGAVRSYASRAKADGIPVYAYATSALREASNATEFLKQIGDAVPITILSGAQEGQMAYFGATGGRGTLLDIGGGSFQFATGDRFFSAPVGCVRFRDRIADATPEELYEHLCGWADAYLSATETLPKPVIGVGGTITTLGALLLGQTVYNGSALCRVTITTESLDRLLAMLTQMGERRKAHPLLHNRYDVILHGGTILKYLMNRLSISAVIPSDRDGMEGFAEAILQRKISVK